MQHDSLLVRWRGLPLLNFGISLHFYCAEPRGTALYERVPVSTHGCDH